MLSHDTPLIRPLKHAYWTMRARTFIAASKVGERLGVEWLTYNAVVFEHFASAAALAAPGFASAVRATFPDVRTAADVGCGTGHFVDALRKAGIAAAGYEYSQHGRRIARERLGVDIHPLDLTDPSLQVIFPADLALSIEVAEHVAPPLGETLIDLLVHTAPIVVFTAATPGQGGNGHVNEQPPEYWHERFARRGYAHDADVSLQLKERCLTLVVGSPWIAKNLMVFRCPSGM